MDNTQEILSDKNRSPHAINDGRSKEERGNPPPPRNRKNVVENDVISEVPIFINKIPKNSKKLNFSIEFVSKKFNFLLKISEPFLFFVQTREKLTHGLLNFLKNMLK